MCGPFLLFIKELAGGNWSVLLCVTLCWKNLTEWLIMPASPSFMCYCAHGQHQSKLVFYTQSTGMVISGQGNIKVSWCFTPSQLVWLYQGEATSK